MELEIDGDETLGVGVLPQGSITEVEIFIKVPDTAYTNGGEHEFAIAQAWKGSELGRVTWRFAAVDLDP